MSSWIRGTATDYKDLSDAILKAATGSSISSPTINAAGTGYTVGDLLTVAGGTYTIAAQLKVLTVTSGAVATVSIEEAGAYSVHPTDPVAQASVTPTGGSGATFNLTLEDGERVVILEGSGGGSDEIFVGWRTFSNVSDDYYNLELRGMSGYASGLSLQDQTGVSPGSYDGTTVGQDTDGSYLTCANVSLSYYLNINSYRIIGTVNVGSNYNHFHLGWGNRFATSSQYPYPMLIAGNAQGFDTSNSDSSARSTLTDPWSDSATSIRGPMQFRDVNGTWQTAVNRKYTSPQDDLCVIPAQAPQGRKSTPSATEDRFMSLNGSFSDFIWSLATGTTGTPVATLLPGGDNSTRLLLPAIIVASDPLVGVIMELDEVRWCSAYGGITNGDRFKDQDGSTWRIFQNCNRTDNYAYLAIKESD